MPRNPVIEFDQLRLYFGEPYVIDLEGIPGSVTVYSPTIGDIIQIGEKRFYQNLNIFITNTTQYRVFLWDFGVDWNDFSDFQLFTLLYNQIDPEVARLMFGDLNFANFQPLVKHKDLDDEQGEVILWSEEDQIEINSDVHNHFSQYLRNVFGMFPEEKITHDDILKQWYITKDKRAIENAKKLAEAGKKKPEQSMKSIVSAMVNHPGFKYKLKELKEVGVAEFYDSVKRLQVYEQSTALLKGMFSGFVDGSKIKPEEYNFMRDIK